MARNIEIKARVKDVKATEQRVERLAGKHTAILHQEDIFYNVPNGRLKLRLENEGCGQLIHYVREDKSGPKRSDYEIVQISDVDRLRVVLSAALGIRGTVKKKRRLYIIGATRIHLDDVDGLGSFLELEILQTEKRNEPEPKARAEELMRTLGINHQDLIECAYIDLLEKERG